MRGSGDEQVGKPAILAGSGYGALCRCSKSQEREVGEKLVGTGGCSPTPHSYSLLALDACPFHAYPDHLFIAI